MAVIGELVATGMPKHVRMNWEGQTRIPARFGHQLADIA